MPTLPPAPGQLVSWWEGNPQLAADGTTYVGNTGGGAYALDGDGHVRWAHQRGNSGVDDARPSAATGRPTGARSDLATFDLLHKTYAAVDEERHPPDEEFQRSTG